MASSTSSKYWSLTNNIVWNTRSPSANAACNIKGFDTRIRNNVFDISLCNQGAANIEHRSNHDFSRNIVYANSPLKSHPDGTVGPGKDGSRCALRIGTQATMASMDNNVYYNARGSLSFAEFRKNQEYETLDKWREATRGSGGFDANSRIVDPKFVNAAARDYRLRETSEALDMGIYSIDTSSIGLLQDFPFAPASDPLQTVFLKANGRDVYVEVQPGATVTLQVSGRTKGWYVADLSNAVIRYGVDNCDVAAVPEEGKVTLRGKGRACITATVTLGEVTRSDDVVVYVGVARGARQ